MMFSSLLAGNLQREVEWMDLAGNLTRGNRIVVAYGRDAALATTFGSFTMKK